MSVKAKIQEIIAMGKNTFPIIKYHSTVRVCRINTLIINDTASGNQRVDNESQQSPTSKYNLFLNFPYFEIITNPMMKEITT